LPIDQLRSSQGRGAEGGRQSSDRCGRPCGRVVRHHPLITEELEEAGEPGDDRIEVFGIQQHLRRVQPEEDLLDVLHLPLRQVAIEIAPLEVQHLGGDPAEAVPSRGLLEARHQIVTGGVERVLIVGSETHAHVGPTL
jgi:hypothetical protein